MIGLLRVLLGSICVLTRSEPVVGYACRLNLGLLENCTDGLRYPSDQIIEARDTSACYFVVDVGKHGKRIWPEHVANLHVGQQYVLSSGHSMVS